ncbi:MAG: DNA polymerase (family X) [Parcubacteria group bacterium Greene0714_21]|nr:MAG: DNA polymerase (family X) [Parcubacteria group bacterium Greene0416_39]TSC97770.1 MAG: DNA polymerase (family X) [Parcubacteria group bacterium Greene1014_47]TSD04244.1 MAG: DNA polymerase (family X) [Parcubacteria group bacterium Greene0714_21]
MEKNEKIASLLKEIADLLDIKGVAFKPAAYRRAAQSIEALDSDLRKLYKKEGLKGIKKIKGVGQSIAQKIEEYIKTRKIKYYEELRNKTIIRQIVTHFFETKNIPLDELKKSARKRDIIYGRYAKSARELLDLAGSVQKAKEAITKVAQWAKTRNLDYSLETVLKKWLELNQLKPKEAVKKAFYKNKPMVWVETKKKWFVVTPEGEWLEFADKEKEIEWRIVK